ncbi:MAG: 2Fe-2S iron-sulfur cluster-binding protein [Polyangiaceae bacterium]
MQPTRLHHEQHRALTIRGKAYCDSACVFCIEKFSTRNHPVAPRSDEIREAILRGAGKYNLLFFMNGEPSLHPKLFEYVELAKAHDFRTFGMSSHFRSFADPHFALKTLQAGFEFFDISLHAATLSDQERVNPIDDGGDSLKEALHGLRNMYEIGRRHDLRVAVTHKIVVSRLNYRSLLPIFATTFKYGVRSYILQPVKTAALAPEARDSLAINEDEFMPFVNAFLKATEGSGAEIKLYGMSQLGAYPSADLVQEANLIRHVRGRRDTRPAPDYQHGNFIVSAAAMQSTAPAHQITVLLPSNGDERTTFSCAEDQFILNAALASGVALPFGCRMGSCGMCTARLVSGSVDRAYQGVLTDEQIERGFTALCRTRPKSDLVLLTHQETELGY